MDREEKDKHISSLINCIRQALVEYASKNKNVPLDDSSIPFMAFMEILHNILHGAIDTGIPKEEVISYAVKVFETLIISLEKH